MERYQSKTYLEHALPVSLSRTITADPGEAGYALVALDVRIGSSKLYFASERASTEGCLESASLP